MWHKNEQNYWNVIVIRIVCYVENFDVYEEQTHDVKQILFLLI